MRSTNIRRYTVLFYLRVPYSVRGRACLRMMADRRANQMSFSRQVESRPCYQWIQNLWRHGYDQTQLHVGERTGNIQGYVMKYEDAIV